MESPTAPAQGLGRGTPRFVRIDATLAMAERSGVVVGVFSWWPNRPVVHRMATPWGAPPRTEPITARDVLNRISPSVTKSDPMARTAIRRRGRALAHGHPVPVAPLSRPSLALRRGGTASMIFWFTDFRALPSRPWFVRLRYRWSGPSLTTGAIAADQRRGSQPRPVQRRHGSGPVGERAVQQVLAGPRPLRSVTAHKSPTVKRLMPRAHKRPRSVNGRVVERPGAHRLPCKLGGMVRRARSCSTRLLPLRWPPRAPKWPFSAVLGMR